MKDTQTKNPLINNTRDHPILFDTEMVQAILSGAKKETRRIIKPQPVMHNGNDWPWKLTRKKGPVPYDCPYGVPGDFLWVKETFMKVSYPQDKSTKSFTYYKAGSETPVHSNKWSPSIHMPKTASRIWLEITSVKAQRIQSVTEYEASKEGTKKGKILNYSNVGPVNFREGFFMKWIDIYGIENFYENPWIWAIEYRVVSTEGIEAIFNSKL